MNHRTAHARRTLPLIALFALISAAAAAGNGVLQKPARLGLCAACHGERGVAADHTIPNLAGQHLDYLRSAAGQYRSGYRQFAAMRAALGMVDAAELDRILRWYAAQPPYQPPRSP